MKNILIILGMLTWGIGAIISESIPMMIIGVLLIIIIVILWWDNKRVDYMISKLKMGRYRNDLLLLKAMKEKIKKQRR